MYTGLHDGQDGTHRSVARWHVVEGEQYLSLPLYSCGMCARHLLPEGLKVLGESAV